MNEWRIVFWTAFVIFALTSVIYGIWASGETQPWNNPEKEPLEEDGDVDEKSVQNEKGIIEEKEKKVEENGKNVEKSDADVKLEKKEEENGKHVEKSDGDVKLKE